MNPLNHTALNGHLDKWFESEAHFSLLYPTAIQQLDPVHWTPLAVATKAMNFLKTGAGVRILDIGSGIGKFCLAGAYHKPRAQFVGVEQRRSLIEYARSAQGLLGLDNATFIQGNFTQVDFKEFNHFYFFNSFGENLTEQYRIDESIDYSAELYHYYSTYLHYKLDTLRSGTRFVNYCSLDDEVPLSYQLMKTYFEGKLKCWVKR
jgi:SAM-dependent methyltransferase